MRSDETIESVRILDGQALAKLPDEELLRMAEAGAEVLNIHRILAKTGANIVGELLKTQEGFFEWDHLPKGDVYDKETHAQYYYHAHAADKRFEGEHGHFHTFLRSKGMPAEIKPADVPGASMPDDKDNCLSHLVGVSMDPRGHAFRLFTVNRWVTGEVWYEADAVKRMLDFFVIDHTWPSWPVNRWISAIVPLFKPQIGLLLDRRDRTIAEWVAEVEDTETPEEEVFEDREREITSFLDIDVQTHVSAIQDEIRRRDT